MERIVVDFDELKDKAKDLISNVTGSPSDRSDDRDQNAVAPGGEYGDEPGGFGDQASGFGDQTGGGYADRPGGGLSDQPGSGFGGRWRVRRPARWRLRRPARWLRRPTRRGPAGPGSVR